MVFRDSDSTIISQNPDIKKSITILRSNNEKTGIEFTWSVWLFMNVFTSDTKYHHVFNKGNKEPGNDGIVSPNNAPGLYINPKYNGIRVIMNSFNDPVSDTIDINDLPISKWMNVVVRVQGKKIDDLQAVIALCRKENFDQPLQYINMRN